jgi:hypothetical protein
MKKITTVLFSLALITAYFSGYSQVVGETFRISEINPMVDNYFQPFGRALATGMGAGWTHTANVHKKLGFDVTFSGAVVLIPSSASTFNTSAIGMGNKFYFTKGNLDTRNGNMVISPTVRGKDNIDVSMIHRTVANSNQDVAFESD